MSYRTESIMKTYQFQFESPVGLITLGADVDGALTHLYCREAQFGETDAAPFTTVMRQLDEYFAGERKVFELDMAMKGTEFQKSIWDLLVKIPFGETRSYGELAKEIGNPNASRAVGAANGANPIAIIVPCHRVIGSNGSLTGFAYGTSMKKWLLDHECTQSGLFPAQK